MCWRTIQGDSLAEVASVKTSIYRLILLYGSVVDDSLELAI